MFKQFITTGVVVMGLAACGGGGSSDSSGSEANKDTATGSSSACKVVGTTISLSSGESCSISSTLANQFNVTSGTVSCSNKTISYNGSSFTAGTGGIVLNGLTFACGA